VKVGSSSFLARLEIEMEPRACAYFSTLLPYSEGIIHACRRAKGCWISLGELDAALGYENPTSYPAPDEFIFYPDLLPKTTCCSSDANRILARDSPRGIPEPGEARVFLL
jgi:Protein of unknown function (DUF3830)